MAAQLMHGIYCYQIKTELKHCVVYSGFCLVLDAVFFPPLMLARLRENEGDYKSQALTCFDLAGGWGMFRGLVPSF